MLTRRVLYLSRLPKPTARTLPSTFQLSPLSTMSDMPQPAASASAPESGADTPLSLSGLSSALPSHEPSRGTTPAPVSHTAEAGPSTLRMSVIDKWLKPDGPPRDVPFGARKLGDADDVFSMNAWDHAELPDDFEERAAEIMEQHRNSPVPEDKTQEYNARPAKYWDKFYSNHKDQFFKNRRWLPLEFPELVACCEPDAGPKTILEVGCGAGNTVFPLLMHNENPDLRIFATDYSAKAVKVVQASPLYPRAEHGLGVLQASVWDITSRPEAAKAEGTDGVEAEAESSAPSSTTAPTYSLPEGIEPNSVDVLSVIYVLSALHPDEWSQAMHNLYSALKPGGLLVIRDYGRHDLAQLRITKQRLLDVPNLYIRGDGTRVYFFERDQLGGMLTAPPRGQAEGSMFEIKQLEEDRRLLVNRKRKLQMYRIWLQAKATKIA